MVKKLLFSIFAVILSGTILASCTANPDDSASLQKIKIGASPTPHAEILEVAKEVLAENGYELEITEFVDYIQPNLALANEEIDANFFQHQPYLDDFNAENNTNLISFASIHYEPVGLYPGRIASLDALVDGASIALPNDTTNEARALLLLQDQGLLKVTPGLGLKITINDIIENPKNIDFKEIEAAQIARSLQDVDFAVINGNYALQAGLNVRTDALVQETDDSMGASTFANILAIRSGDEEREDLQALVDAMKSEKVKTFIEEKYNGAIIPLF